MKTENDPRKAALQSARLDCRRAHSNLKSKRALLSIAERKAAAVYSEENEAARLAAAARVAVAAAALERCRVRFAALISA